LKQSNCLFKGPYFSLEHDDPLPERFSLQPFFL